MTTPADRRILPVAQAVLVDRTGRATPTFYDFLRRLVDTTALTPELVEEVKEILAKIEDLPTDGFMPITAQVKGQDSIEWTGLLSNGLTLLNLRGDTSDQRAGWYYGTGASTEKGWHRFYTALETGAGILKRNSGYVELGEVDDASDLPLSGNPGEAYWVRGAGDIEERGLWVWDADAGEWALDTEASGIVGFEIAEGDYGDISVSDEGATWTINENVVTDEKLRDSAALSVIGRASNSTGDPADIVASVDKAVLHRNGTSLAFAPIDHTYISDFAEAAQDAVGGILTNTADIEFTYDDSAGEISAELSSTVHASLALADSALQPGDNISELVNDANYVASGDNVSVLVNDAGYLVAADLAAVAFSGDYDDLINTPTIPPDISSATFITADDETATLANSLKLVAGSNVTFDTSTPGELKISASGGGGGGTVESVIGTTNEIDVDSSDPANPVVSLANAVRASLALADSAVQPGDLAAVAFSGDYADLSNRPAIPTPADPTAKVGLTAVNGSASTFMRSDAAPALDQGISPTWTGEHIFTMPTTFIDDVSISGDNLELQLGESADLRLYHDGTDSFVRSDTGLLRLNLGSTSALALSASAAEFRVRPYINLNSVSSVPAQAIASDANFLIASATAHMSIELIAANGGTNGIRFISASGGFDSLGAIKPSTNQYLGYLGVGGYDGTAWAVPSAGLIGLSPAADWSSTSHPTLIVFETTAINSTTRSVRVRINHDGTMQITDGSASFPGLSFLQDNDTGLTRLGSNHLALVTGGTARLALKPGGQVRLIPLSSDPPGAENGDIYYNSSMNKFRGYVGGSWVNLH